MAMLRDLFQTKNRLALPMSGTGSAGMETCFVNLVEPGDSVLIGVNGVFGTRMVDVAQRCGAQVDTVEAEWGTALDPAQFRAALAKKSFKVVALVHAETSTGVLQPLDEIARLVHEHDSLLLIDTVTSLGGAPVRVDELGIDACYSGTQKCLSCPPGLSPVTFSERAVEAVRKRKAKVQSWYLDLSMIEKYWGSERVYHHTAPISMRMVVGGLGAQDKNGLRVSVAGGESIALLFEISSGNLLAVMGYPFSNLRISATVGLAVDRLSKPKAKSIALIGSGRLAMPS